MSGVSRAYRDTNSPLLPLTPLSANENFSFHMGGDSSLRPWIDQIDAKRGKNPSSSGLYPPQQLQHVSRSPVSSCGCACATGKSSSTSRSEQQQYCSSNLQVSHPSTSSFYPSQRKQYCSPNIQVSRSPVSPCGTQKSSPWPFKKLASYFKFNMLDVDQSSPVFKPDDRLFFLLKKVGMQKYWGVFKQEHVDLDKFQSLTLYDLEYYYGFKKRDHINKILEAQELARTMY